MASHPELYLADLPGDDPAHDDEKHQPANLPQGDARLIVRNAVLWAAGQEIDGMT